MDQPEHSQQQPVMGVVAGGPQMAYASPPYQPVPVSSPNQLSYQQQQQQQQLQVFWSNQMHEIERTTDFKNHSLPLARIKKIMKADEDVRMISAEAPVIFAKACEMFILELTLRSWLHTEENKRRTLQKNDIAAAISRTDVFDFLVDIIPRDELKDEGLGIMKATIPMAGSLGDPIPYYYVPTAGPAAGMYPPGQSQARPPAAFVPWPQSQPPPRHQIREEESDT